MRWAESPAVVPPFEGQPACHRLPGRDPPMTARQKLKIAIEDLKITVPVLAFQEVRGGGLNIYLYGGNGKPVRWKPKTTRSSRKKSSSS